MLKRQKNFRFILFVAEGLKFSLKYLGMKSVSFSLNFFLFSPRFCSFQYPKEACYFFRLVCEDICNGQENICIPATNVIDVPPMAPEGMLHFSTCTRLFLLLSSYYATTNGIVKCSKLQALHILNLLKLQKMWTFHRVLLGAVAKEIVPIHWLALVLNSMAQIFLTLLEMVEGKVWIIA